jgi:predicted NAD-dependent protein-ADP-ribosyltransferase YbiA (DUF1768 family)
MAPKRKRAKNTASKGAASTPAPAPDANGPIYFWRPQETATGYLSQWFNLPFRDKNDETKIYPTAEHYSKYTYLSANT